MGNALASAEVLEADKQVIRTALSAALTDADTDILVAEHIEWALSSYKAY